MSNTKSIPKRRASDGGHRLRVRGVLVEGDKERAAEKRLKEQGFKAKQRNFADVDPAQLAAFPLVREYLAEHSGFLPAVRTGSNSQAKATRQRLEVMRRNSGPLVMVTEPHPNVHLQLKSRLLADVWAALLPSLLDEIAPSCPAYTAVLQAGRDCAGLHTHAVLPLAALRPDLATFARAQPSGARGGGLHESGLHFVVLDAKSSSTAKVASYLTRNPDGRFDKPNTPEFFAAHEENLARAGTGKSPKLTSYRLPRSWRQNL